jgi:predicted transcriptional regulator
MKIEIDEKWLPIYQALASDVRIKIIQLLARKPMNIKELAEQLGLSSAILSMHVRKLEEAQLIMSERSNLNGAVQKLCKLVVDHLEIDFPDREGKEKQYHEFHLPVGHYTDFDIRPTCGIATREKVVGYFDDPRYFLDPERVNAGILWFTRGFVEYRVPNHTLRGQLPEELEISMELCSEAPGVNNNWPSDVSFFLNEKKLGEWTSPGDFGGVRGRFTPEWWSLGVAQFGVLKVLRINREGTFVDGNRISEVTLEQIDIEQKQWVFRIAVLEDARYEGGVTLFGSGFGNYDQDIVFRLYYR